MIGEKILGLGKKSLLVKSKANKLIFLAWFFISAGLLIGVTFGTYLVIADEVSDSEVLDVTAIVPGAVSDPGSGGGVTAPIATVVLSGTAFPNAKLTLLKDGSISTTLIANPDGTFQITINNLNFGNYQFSIYSEDPTGQISATHVLNVSAFTSQPYVYSGIILPPTLSASGLLIKIGDIYSVFGYSAPGSTVTLLAPNGNGLGSAVADSIGLYRISLTANLAAGIYSLRATANLNGRTSLPSKPIQVLFYSSTLPPDQIPTPPPQFAQCVDYNKDRRVNLIDFSILLFWFGKSPIPPSVDCNSDAVIDIKDFSILMYFWTG